MVTLRFCDEEVAIIVSDDGRAGKKADGLGHGLIGMRERVELFGGTVTAGPKPGGGFQVTATLPVHPARSSSGTAAA
jgi:signal transduction histidine kinase